MFVFDRHEARGDPPFDMREAFIKLALIDGRQVASLAIIARGNEPVADKADTAGVAALAVPANSLIPMTAIALDTLAEQQIDRDSVLDALIRTSKRDFMRGNLAASGAAALLDRLVAVCPETAIPALEAWRKSAGL